MNECAEKLFLFPLNNFVYSPLILRLMTDCVTRRNRFLTILYFFFQVLISPRSLAPRRMRGTWTASLSATSFR